MGVVAGENPATTRLNCHGMRLKVEERRPVAGRQVEKSLAAKAPPARVNFSSDSATGPRRLGYTCTVTLDFAAAGRQFRNITPTRCYNAVNTRDRFQSRVVHHPILAGTRAKPVDRGRGPGICKRRARNGNHCSPDHRARIWNDASQHQRHARAHKSGISARTL